MIKKHGSSRKKGYDGTGSADYADGGVCLCGMLAATPAGATDMALISADLGITNAKLIVLQVLRMITVILVFPPVLEFVVYSLGG